MARCPHQQSKDCRLALDRAAGAHPADSPHSRTQTRDHGDSRTDMDSKKHQLLRSMITGGMFLILCTTHISMVKESINNIILKILYCDNSKNSNIVAIFVIS